MFLDFADNILLYKRELGSQNQSIHLHKPTYLVIGNKKAYSGLEIWIKNNFLTINNPIFLAKLINAQFRIATEIQAFQTILKFPIPWISSKNYETPSSAKRYSGESCIWIKNRERIGVILTRIRSMACLKFTSRRSFDKSYLSHLRGLQNMLF